jgi:uronate dehydrogenase
VAPDGRDDFIVGDVTDVDTVERALQGADAVLHLAGDPSIDQPWSRAYGLGIGGTYAVLEAARRAGVSKAILASSSYVSGWREIREGRAIDPDTPMSPTTPYGVGKLTLELLGRYFATQFGTSVICVRIGAFYAVPPRPESASHDILRTWCSPRDLAQLVRRSIDAEGVRFAIFYGVSNNTRNLWDITNARELVGYAPEDNAEDLLDPAAYGRVLRRALQSGRPA